MQNKLDNLTLDQFTKNLRELRDSGKWEQMSPVAQYNASVKFQKIYEHLSQKEQTQSRVEGLNAIKEEDEQLQELSQKYRQERNPVVNVLGDLIRGTVSLPTSTARISGLALDRLGAKSAGSALTRYAQNQEENAAIFLPPPDEGAGWGEKIFGAAAENAVPMVATGFGTGSLLSGAAKLGAGSKALKAIEIAGTSLGMSAPEIIKESTTFDEYGNPILPKSVLPIVAGSLLHGGIETGFGLSPVSLVTKGKGKFLTGLFAKDTLKRIAAFNKRYGPAKTAAIVAKRLFKDTPLGDSLGEGLEEVLQSPVTILTKNLANNDAETALNSSIQEMANLGYLKELGEEFVIGAGVGALYGGARTTIDKIDNAIESKQTSLEEKQELARRKEEILISEEEMNRAKEEEIRQNMAGQLSGNLAALKGREAEIMPESQTPWKPTTESDYRGSGISLQRKRNDTLIYPASSHVSAAQAVEKRVSPDQKPQLQDYANAVIRATMQGDESVIPLETAQQLLRDRNKIQDLEARINEDGGFGLKNGKPFPSIEIAKKFIDKSSFKADMVILPHSSGKGFIVAPDVAGEQFKQREMKNQAAAQMQREHIGGIKDIKTDSIGASKPTKDMSNRPQKVNSIKEVYEAATDQENKGRKVWHDISRVTAEEAAHLSAKTGLAIDENTVHMIDSDGVRHAFNGHGHESEHQRGQIPITSEDLEKIADVLGNYDSVEKLQGLNKLGHEVIQYKKRINGHIFFLEEYRPSRNKLALATMWKKKAPSTQQHTSETSRPRKSLLESVEGASTSIIASPEEEVKLEQKTETPKNRKAPMRAIRGTSDLEEAFQKAETSATSSIPTSEGGVKGAEKARKVSGGSILEYESERREDLLKEALAKIESSGRTDAEKKMLRKYVERAYREKYIGQSTLAKANKLLEGIKSKDIEAYYRVDTRSDEAARVMFESFIGKRLRRKEALGVIEEYFREGIDKYIAERKAYHEAARAKAKKLIEEPKEAEKAKKVEDKPAVSERKTGDFGPIFDEYSNDLKGAIKILSKEKTGEVPGVLHHKDIGAIDLVWGKEGTGRGDGFGLSKIIKFHPEVVENLQKVLDDTEIKQKSDNRVVLESQKFKGIVSLNYFQNEKKWLLSAYEKEESLSKKTIDTLETDNISKEDDKLSSNRLNPSIPSSGGGVKPAEKAKSGEKIDKDVKLYSVEYLVAEYAAKGLKQAAKVVRRGIEIFASSRSVKKLVSSTKHFAQWARQMVNEFGQNVKKYLRGLYKDVTTAYNRQK
ncbi:MAG: hypothetical protein PHF29_08885, partial [Candidatus Riflebacteria bacterium]|nr:hypothetical protein [Candidatus Riflebacteria bacterium]